MTKYPTGPPTGPLARRQRGATTGCAYQTIVSQPHGPQLM